MKTDFIKRLGLTLAAIGLAATAVVGTFAMAGDNVPVMKSNDIPFDPFGSPPVPKVESEVPQKSTTSSTARPTVSMARLPMVLSTTSATQPKKAQPATSLPWSARPSSTSVVNNNFVPSTTATTDSAASSKPNSVTGTSTGGTFKAPATTLPASPVKFATESNRPAATGPASSTSSMPQIVQTPQAKSTDDLAIQRLPTIVRPTSSAQPATTAPELATRSDSNATHATTSPTSHAMSSGNPIAATESPTRRPQSVVIESPFARMRAEQTQSTTSGQTSRSETIQLATSPVSLTPSGPSTSRRQDIVTNEGERSPVNNAANESTTLAQSPSSIGTQSLASQTSLSNSSHGGTDTTVASQPRIEPYPIDDQLAEASELSRQLALKSQEQAAASAIQTTAASESTPLTSAHGQSAQTAEFAATADPQQPSAATLIKPSNTSLSQQTQLSQRTQTPSARRSPSVTTGGSAMAAGRRPNSAVQPIDPSESFVDHILPFQGAAPRTMTGRPISGRIPPLTRGGEIIEESMVIPEGEVILDGHMHSVVDGMPFGGDPCQSCPDRTYVVVEGLLFERTGERTQLSSGFKLDGFDYKEGIRFTLGRRNDCLNGWEATYMGVEPWYQYESASSPGGNLQPAFYAGPGFTAANIGTFYNANYNEQFYRSELHSFEFNRTHWGWDVITTSYGLRYVLLNEDMRFTAFKGGDRADLVVETNNHLIGPQIGTELFYDAGRRFYLSTKMRGGAYANINDGAVNYANTGPTTSYFVNTDQNVGFAAIGDLQMNMFFKLTPRARIRAGYEFWYAWGMATAKGNTSRQVGPTMGGNIDDQDDLFFHGLSVGFEFVR